VKTCNAPSGYVHVYDEERCELLCELEEGHDGPHMVDNGMLTWQEVQFPINYLKEEAE
jgi:hypothetical protein